MKSHTRLFISAIWCCCISWGLIIHHIYAASHQKPHAPYADPNSPDPDDPEAKLRIEYKGELTVPKNGKVVILFFPDYFVREPGCSFEGGTLPGKAPVITNYFAKLKAKPGAKMKYRCAGVKHEEK
jgi:hypothetical protein